MQMPPIGTTVLFYKQGDTSSPPMVAFVAGGCNGALELQTLPLYSTTVVRQGNVRHVSDPKLDEFPDARRQYGAWDTVEAGAKRDEEKDIAKRLAVRRREAAEKARQEQQEEAERDGTADILRMHEEGTSAVVIAETMSQKTGQKWSYQRVNSILRAHKKLVHS